MFQEITKKRIGVSEEVSYRESEEEGQIDCLKQREYIQGLDMNEFSIFKGLKEVWLEYK